MFPGFADKGEGKATFANLNRTPSAMDNQSVVGAGTQQPANLLEPMSIGSILDRAVRLTPGLFDKLMIAFGCLAAASVVINFPDVASFSILLTVLLGIFIWLFGFCISVVTMAMAAEHWHGRKITLREGMQRLSVSMLFRFIGLSIRVGIITMLGLLLFIVPGVIYAINRILSWYILVVEDTSIDEAVQKSKFLMTRDRWYSLSGPYMRVTAIFIVVFIVSMIAGMLTAGSMALLISDGYVQMAGAVVQFVTLMIQYLAQALSALCYVGLYYDLRARYEGADILDDVEKLGTQGMPA